MTANRDPMKTIGHLMDKVGDPPPSDLEMCKQVLRNELQRSPAIPNNMVLIRMGIAAAAVALAIAVGFVIWAGPDKISYRIGTHRPTSHNGAWISSGIGAPIPIVFDNGSRFELATNSAARVVESNNKQVRLDLSQGRLDANVNGNGETEWIVQAGPYEVKVLGTRFSVHFSSIRNQLEVEVASGKVAVNGTQMSTGVLLKTGQRLVANATGTQVQTVDEPKHPAGEGSLVSSKSSKNEGNPLDSSDTKIETPTAIENKANSSVAKVQVPKWRKHANAQEWPEAVKAMDNQTAISIAQSRELDLLWSLANAARYSERPQLATLFLNQIRLRFGDTSRGKTAIFLLAKTALDAHKDLPNARKWFLTYLKTIPNGALAEEATGYLMEVCLKMNHMEESAQFAQTYLENYQTGPFANRARRIRDLSANNGDGNP